MNKEDFDAVLAEAEMTADELTESFRELTVEEFEGLEEPAQHMMVALYDLSEEDLSDTELGAFFAEEDEEEEEVSLNESIVETALRGNIVDTQAAFDDALQVRIDEKISAMRDAMSERLFEDAVEEEFTFAQVMEESELSLEDMIYVAENMSEEEFLALEESERDVVATFSRIYEGAEGNIELIEAAINENLLAEISASTMQKYTDKAADQRGLHKNWSENTPVDKKIVAKRTRGLTNAKKRGYTPDADISQ